MSFGIGAFPFGFFATNFNLGENHSGHAHVHGMRGHGTGTPEGTAQYAEEQFLHKVKYTFFFSLFLLLSYHGYVVSSNRIFPFLILGVPLGCFPIHLLVTNCITTQPRYNLIR